MSYPRFSEKQKSSGPGPEDIALLEVVTLASARVAQSAVDETARLRGDLADALMRVDGLPVDRVAEAIDGIAAVRFRDLVIELVELHRALHIALETDHEPRPPRAPAVGPAAGPEPGPATPGDAGPGTPR
jgi:hypothetical protein